VDRNGNGDLTEPGEKVTAKKALPGDTEKGYMFEVGELSVGGRTHKGLLLGLSPIKSIADNSTLMAMPHIAAAVRKYPDGLTGALHVDVECASLKGGGIGGRVGYLLSPIDTTGVFQFASKPADAPIVHFDGRLQITFFAEKPKWTGGRSQDTVLCIGTPGSGPGTFVMVKYEGTVPEKLHPKLAVTFRPTGSAQQPVKELYEVKERC
jgi:hypothetical protein